MKTVAVLGLGMRGRIWAEAFHEAGWIVRAFDPAPDVGLDDRNALWRREHRISTAVQGVDWVAVCLPERIELMQKVMQRAQAEAPDGAVIGVASKKFPVDEIQICALRPASVIAVHSNEDGSFAFDVSPATSAATRAIAETTLAELAAHKSLASPYLISADHPSDAESA